MSDYEERTGSGPREAGEPMGESEIPLDDLADGDQNEAQPPQTPAAIQLFAGQQPAGTRSSPAAPPGGMPLSTRQAASVPGMEKRDPATPDRRAEPRPPQASPIPPGASGIPASAVSSISGQALPTAGSAAKQPDAIPAQRPAHPATPASPSRRPGARTGSSPARPAGAQQPAPPAAAMGVEGMTIRQRVQTQTMGADVPPEPRWVQSVLKMLPGYTDEMAAFVLIGIGLLSFFTLFSPSSGALGTVWSGWLRQSFGYGAFIVSATILAAGALLLVPKIGVRVRINWWRVISGEICFIFLLGMLHLSTRFGLGGEVGQEEAIAAALDGRGGGYVGWAIQELFQSLLGDWITFLTLFVLSLVTGGIMLGMTRQRLREVLIGLHNRLVGFAWRMEGRRYIAVTASEPSSPVASDKLTGGIPELSDEEHLPSAPAVAEYPATMGRPSVVTGETGPLIMKRPAPELTRISPVKYTVEREEHKPQREIRYRFTLQDAPDKRKVKKRGADLPPLTLLDVLDYARPSEDDINLQAEVIEETVDEFGMKVEVVGVKSGPTVTQYAVQPFAQVDHNGQKFVQRVRVTRVAALAQDLSLALSAPRVRIQAPVPGTNYIGVEVPNPRPGVVSLRPIIESERFYRHKSPLTIGLGREVDGTPFAADLTSMPHLLVGGTTGSGKSVCLSAITTCLVMNNHPDELKLIMIDPKMVELIRFNGLPHLLGRVEIELDRIIGVLRWVTREMDRRYKLMEAAQARNIVVYNQGRKKKDRLPYIVIMIDELAELMTEYPVETEHLLTRLAQMARATGIHLVVATQRPSTDIVTGLIKANFPARISFVVASGIDSRVIIDSVGAEELIGRGDMLYYASDAAGPIRLQGCFASDIEMERVVEFWQHHWAEQTEEAPWERSLTRAAVLDETDQMLEDAIRIVQREGEASTSLLQRKLNVSYPRAGRIMDSLYKMGVVGEAQAGGRVRRVMIGSGIDPTTYIVTWRNNH